MNSSLMNSSWQQLHIRLLSALTPVLTDTDGRREIDVRYRISMIRVKHQSQYKQRKSGSITEDFPHKFEFEFGVIAGKR
jgi:hypothetical protein